MLIIIAQMGRSLHIPQTTPGYLHLLLLSNCIPANGRVGVCEWNGGPLAHPHLFPRVGGNRPNAISLSNLGTLINFLGRTQTGFYCALDPGVLE